MILVATCTADAPLPATACFLQQKLGAVRAAACDVAAACTGFVYALAIADAFVRCGMQHVLVVGAEVMSMLMDWTDRRTCILFGDGAGAAVVAPSSNGRGIISSHHLSDGKLAPLLHRPAGGSAMPLDAALLGEGKHLVHMEGREVFKSAVRSMAQSGVQALDDAGLSASDIDIMVPHQANVRIIEATAKYAGIPMEKVFVNLDRYGNISSATIPVALDEALEEGRLRPDSLVLMTAFGAGLTWGAMTLRW